MKKSFLLIASLLALSNEALIAQQNPTPYSTPYANTPAQAVTTSNAAWYRGGNSPGGTAGSANIFGTLWNSPIYTRTNNITWMKLNGSFGAGFPAQYAIGGYPAASSNTSGYLLLGTSTGNASNNTLFVSKGAFSQLHLNGRNGAFPQEGGYRPWMQTGMTLTDNQDMSYLGLRQVGGTLDLTETVISWADNSGNASGPDDFAFRFTAPGDGTSNNNYNDLRSQTDNDGVHIARFCSNGLVGLGNTFGSENIGPAGYVRPQSLTHLSYDRRDGAVNEPFGFLQLTYRNNSSSTTVLNGIGETATDGLRFGIDNDIQNAGFALNYRHLNGYLRWQEASSFIIQTENDNTAGGIDQCERMRITSTGAVNLNQGATGLSPMTNSANTVSPTVNSNYTRVAISHFGLLPITKPMSLLHLGYNTGSNTSQDINVANPIGWRKWMELGMFISNRENHVFLGLKPEGDGSIIDNQRMDAVLSWGEKSVKIDGVQEPDIFRFVFTGNAQDLSETNPYTKSEIGEEMFRIYPGKDSIFDYVGLAPSYNNLDTVYGRVGIGNFSINGVNEQPTHKLDVIGNGRFRFLPDDIYEADADVNKFVMVDSNGVLRWSSNSANSGFTACSTVGGGQLTDNSKIDLNDHNFYFISDAISSNVTENKVGVGYNCDDFMLGRINTKWDREVLEKSTAGYFHNSDKSILNSPTGQSISFTGIQSLVNEVQNLPTDHIGVRADALNAYYNNSAYIGIARGGKKSVGGDFTANSAIKNFGVIGKSSPFSANILALSYNVGGYFSASGNSTVNYGVYASAPISGTNRAGYFLGTLESSVPGNVSSDQMFKTDVNEERDALKTIGKLKPVTYKLKANDFPQFNFNERLQHGFLAQEVGQVLPELVFDSYHPGEEDSIGNEIIAPTSYKSLNYTSLISLNVQATNELNLKVDKQTLSDQSLKTNVNDLTGSLEKIEQMRGVTFDWDYTNHPEMQFDSTNHVGFIAQEINAIDSRLTFVDDNNFMHVDYDKIVPIVVESIDELNEKIESKDSIIAALQLANEDLNTRLSRLESCLSSLLPSLCEMNQSAIQQTPQEIQRQLAERISISLSDKNSLVLSQNVPNPFAEKTVISYNIPTNVAQAQIHFYNATGQLINSVDLKERGNGELTVFANDLSSGIYTYSLVADGKVVATKKMMKN